METRKVYISGGSTYVISLPKKWVEKISLKPGDSLIVSEQGDSLLIETGIIEKKIFVKELEISKIVSSDALIRIIIGYYVVGYDTIHIKLDIKDTLSYRESIRKVLNYLIGIEIVEDTDDSMTLEIMVDYKRMMTKKILQRMFVINRSMLIDLGKALKNNDIGLAKDIIIREQEIDRLYFLVVRQLKSAVEYKQIADNLGIKYQKDCLGFRIVVKVLERISDHIENIAKSYIQLSKIENEYFSEYIELIDAICKTFENSFQAFLLCDSIASETSFQELSKIEKFHSEVSKKLLTPENIRSVILLKTMLDSLERVASYSGDIAEIAINMSVEID